MIGAREVARMLRAGQASESAEGSEKTVANLAAELLEQADAKLMTMDGEVAELRALVNTLRSTLRAVRDAEGFDHLPQPVKDKVRGALQV